MAAKSGGKDDMAANGYDLLLKGGGRLTVTCDDDPQVTTLQLSMQPNRRSKPRVWEMPASTGEWLGARILALTGVMGYRHAEAEEKALAEREAAIEETSA